MVLYRCELCNFNTIIKGNYTKHLNTKKHIKNASRNIECTLNSNTINYINNINHINSTNENIDCADTIDIDNVECDDNIDIDNIECPDTIEKDNIIREKDKQIIHLYKKIYKLLDKVGDTNILNTENIKLNNKIKNIDRHILDRSQNVEEDNIDAETLNELLVNEDLIEGQYEILEQHASLGPYVDAHFIKFKKYDEAGDKELVAKLKQECEAAFKLYNIN